jgi:hypothetical protein
MTAEEFEKFLRKFIEEGLMNGKLSSDFALSIESFKEAGIPTLDRGLLVSIGEDGEVSEFRITIEKLKVGGVEEED